MSEANKALVRRAVADVLNKFDFALADEVFAENFIYRAPHVPELRGPDGFKQVMTAIRTAFPDTHCTINELAGEGDTVIARWTATGTHKGEWMGVAPTGKRVTHTGTTTLRIAGGKIVEHWADWDALGLLQQLGAAPASTEANKALGRRYFEEVLNKGNLALLDEIFASDSVWRPAGLPEMRGVEARRQFITGIRAAFPDIHFTIEELIAEVNKVVVRWTYSGSQTGEWMGIAPTGKRVAGSGTSICRVSGGKIVEWDALCYCQQAGANPGSPQAVAPVAA